MIRYEFIYQCDYLKLADLMDQHKLYEESYLHSRFKKLLTLLKAGEVSTLTDDLAYRISGISIVIAYGRGDKPVGILIFEHFQFDHGLVKKLKKKKFFSYFNKKYHYNVLGFMGLYVKKSYRKKGVASEMVSCFEANIEAYIERKPDTIYLVCAIQKAANIARRTFRSFCHTYSIESFDSWKNSARYFLQCHYSYE